MFDLDDTLYDEMSFVASGFRAVALYAHIQFGCGEAAFFQTCMQVIRDFGRGQVFNIALQRLGVGASGRATDMVDIYRGHRPEIRLDEDAVSTLHALRARQIKCGVITDGLASVQRNKTEALRVSELVDFIIYTDELGREFWKPHELSFRMALENMMMNPAEVAYVGNDRKQRFLRSQLCRSVDDQGGREADQLRTYGSLPPTRQSILLTRCRIFCLSFLQSR